MPIATLEWLGNDKENPWQAWGKGRLWNALPKERELLIGYYSEKWNKRGGEGLFSIVQWNKMKVSPVEWSNESGSKGQKIKFEEDYGMSLQLQISVERKFVDMLFEDGWRLV